MGLSKRIIRYITGHKVKVTGHLTFYAGLVKAASGKASRGDQAKHKKMSSTSETKEDSVAYFLHVEVDRCSDLGKSDAIGESDPFAVLYLNGVKFGRTSVIENTRNPVWLDEAFEMPVFERIAAPVLTIEIYDMDPDGVGDFWGMCTYDLTENPLRRVD